MSQTEKRLNRLAQRIAEQAEHIRYLTSRASPLSQRDSPGSAWLDPVSLPPSDQVIRRLNSVGAEKETTAPRDSESEGSRRTPVLLATHFLEDWYEWQILSYRWAQFLGADERRDVLPQSVAFVEGTEDQVDALIAEAGFMEAFKTRMPTGGEEDFASGLRESLRKLVSDESEPQADSPNPREVISSVARFGEHDRLVRGLARRTEYRYEQMPEWLSDYLSNLQQVQKGLTGSVRVLMEKNDTAASQLRAYRYSSLSLSWLITRNERVFLELFGGNLPFMTRLYQTIDAIGRGPEPPVFEQSEADQVQKVLGRIIRTVGEIGLGYFAKAVEDNRFFEGENTPFAGQSAQIFTSRPETISGEIEDSDICIGLAISDHFYPDPPPRGKSSGEKRRRKRLDQRLEDLDQTLERVKQWLAECGPESKTALIITDLWAPQEFASQHAQIFEAWRSRGADVFVAVPNHKGTSLSVVDSNFG